MREGQSFSGRERNRFLLNLGDAEAGTYTDASAISGFDFPDDSRALAVLDADHDGDLDAWVAGRTSPRVRYLENTLQPSATVHSISFKLEGLEANRDAIGARIVLQPASGRARSRTVRTATGFMSQASRWQHFGLGADSAPVNLAVHWPGQMTPEVISSLRSNVRYVIRQGQGVVEQRPLRGQGIPLKGGAPLDEFPSSFERRAVVSRMPFPAIDAVKEAFEGPMLINVWSRHCATCMAELAEWREHLSDPRLAGVTILPLNGDALAQGDHDQPLEDSKGVFEKIMRQEIPYRELSEAELRILDAFQKQFQEARKVLAVPFTFLIDAYGRVAVLYRGRVPFEILVQDLESLKSPEMYLLTDLGGRWLHPPAPNPPLIGTAQALATKGFSAETYLRQCLQEVPEKDPHRYSRSLRAELHFSLGTELLIQEKPQEAFAQLLRTVDLNPNHAKANANLGFAHFQMKRWPLAEQHFSRALNVSAENPELWVNRGQTRKMMGNINEAARDFQQALQRDPDHLRALYELALVLRNSNPKEAIALLNRMHALAPASVEARYHLAGLLSTTSDPDLRDAPRALQLAAELVAEQSEAPEFLSILAASQAANGQFADAVASIDTAIEKVPEGSPLKARFIQMRQQYQLQE